MLLENLSSRFPTKLDSNQPAQLEASLNMSCDARKPVSEVSDRARLKPVSLATEILVVTSLDMILSSKQITKALIRLCGCAG